MKVSTKRIVYIVSSFLILMFVSYDMLSIKVLMMDFFLFMIGLFYPFKDGTFLNDFTNELKDKDHESR